LAFRAASAVPPSPSQQGCPQSPMLPDGMGLFHISPPLYGGAAKKKTTQEQKVLSGEHCFSLSKMAIL